MAAGESGMPGVFKLVEFLVEKQEAFLRFGKLVWRGGTAEALK
jgi:hypothetical protein